MKVISVLRTSLLFCFICLSISLSAQRNPVSWEGISKKINNGQYEIKISANIQSGWYVYAQKPEGDMGPVPTSLEFEGGDVVGEAIESGNREEGMDKAFGMKVVKYLDKVTFTQLISVTPGATEVKCIVNFMTCNGEMCLPPKNVEVLVTL